MIRCGAMSERAMPAWLVKHLIDIGIYAVRIIDGVRMAEPVDKAGPAYVENPASGWWEYVYDVATGDVTVC